MNLSPRSPYGFSRRRFYGVRFVVYFCPVTQRGHADFATVAFLSAIALFKAITAVFVNAKRASVFKTAGIEGVHRPNWIGFGSKPIPGPSLALRFGSNNSQSCSAHVMPAFPKTNAANAGGKPHISGNGILASFPQVLSHSH